MPPKIPAAAHEVGEWQFGSADIGCSAPQIASITGHATLAMVQKYIERADRKRMGREAMAKLIEGGW